jgi:hypothetical protein
MTLADAAELGITRSAVRHAVARHRWLPLVRGIVLTAPGPPTREDWVLVGMAIAGPAAALSGWDALRTYGLGAAEPPSRSVLVLDRGGSHRRIGCVLVRPTSRPYATQLLPFAHPTLPYVPIVPAARAVADTALMYRRFAPVRALVTTSVQRRKCSPGELVAELEACPRNGSRMFRRALADVLDGARSIAEAEAVDFLRRVAVPAFELNVPILDHTGVRVSVADVLWREMRAVAEIDSREYHLGEKQWKGTGHRHNRLTTGWLALEHFPPSEIRSRRMDWARDVEIWLRGRARELGLPYRPGRGPIRAGPDGPPPLVLPPPTPPAVRRAPPPPGAGGPPRLTGPRRRGT